MGWKMSSDVKGAPERVEPENAGGEETVVVDN